MQHRNRSQRAVVRERMTAPVKRDLRRVLCTGAACSALVGCADRPAGSGGTVFTDSAGVRIASTRIDEDDASCLLSESTTRIGTISGDSAYELYRVNDATRLEDGRIVVLNAGTWQVKIFDSAGKVVEIFGRRGEGPAEFRNLWSVDVRGTDTLVIGEYRHWRFSFFGTDGEFQRAIEVQPRVVERPEVAVALSDGNGFLIGERCCFTEQDGFADETVIIRHYDATGRLTDTIGTFWFQEVGFLSRELRYVGGPIFGARAAFAPYPGDTLIYGSGRSEQVEFRTRDGELRRIIRWTGRDRRVRGEDVEEWKRQFRAGFSGDLTSARSREILESQVGDHRPVAQTFPAHYEWNGLLVSRNGGVWIKESRRPFDEGPGRWFVFHPSGELACQVMIPDAVQLLEVGEDFIIGMERDTTGVEYIVHHYCPAISRRAATG